MQKQTKEWLYQSQYDFDTADIMYGSGRYIYAVFMCHLAIEKALKGLLFEQTRTVPPKSHNLVLLLTRLKQRPPDHLGKVIVRLSEASIPTRYPEDLAKAQKDFSESRVQEVLNSGKEVLDWIKKQL